MMRLSSLYKLPCSCVLLCMVIGYISIANAKPNSKQDSCVSLCSTTFYGPERFFRTSGPKNEYTVSISVPIGVSGPFNLHIQNGEADGTNRVSSATISIINGQTVLVQADVNQNVAYIDKCVSLDPINTMNITLASKPGSYLAISICGNGSQPPYDKTPPTIDQSLNPLPNIYGWNNTPVTVSYICSDAQSGVSQCPSPSTVTQESRAFIMSGTAVDNAGNTATATTTVKLDKTAPQVSIASPANDLVTSTSEIIVRGDATDNLSGVSTVMCSGVAAIISGTVFTANLKLEEGQQQIVATATDSADNTASTSITITLDTKPPVVTIHSPTEGTYSRSEALPELDYSVSDNIDSDPSIVFSGWSLDEGAHTTVVVAQDKAGNRDSSIVNYTVDNTPPTVTITEPREGKVYAPKAVPIPVYTITDNLDPAPLTTITGWNDNEGMHTVLVTATDKAGNVAIDSVAYIVRANRSPVLSHVSNTCIMAGNPFSIAVHATDPDNDALTFSAPWLPDYASVSDNGNGTCSVDFLPQLDDTGLVVIAISVTDGAIITSDTFSVNVYPELRWVSNTYSALNNCSPEIIDRRVIGDAVAVLNTCSGGIGSRQAEGISCSILNNYIEPYTCATGKTCYILNMIGPVDLLVSDVNTTGLTYNSQNLTVSGELVQTIRNIGVGYVKNAFKILVFRDINQSNSYENGIDSVLSTTIITDTISPNKEYIVRTTIQSPVSFAGEPIWIFVDAENTVEEFNEENNLFSTAWSSTQNPVAIDFDPQIKLRKDSFSYYPASNNCGATPAVADINQDGIPDIVFCTFEGQNYWENGILRAISGKDGSEIFNIAEPSLQLEPGVQIAIGDIDHDSLPEIIAAHENDDILVFENNGVLKWRKNVVWTNTYGACGSWPEFGCFWTCGAISIADLEGDGIPEIIAGTTVLEPDGTVRFSAGLQNYGDNGFGSITTVADIDLDGKQEIIAGGAWLKSNGALYFQNPYSGYTAVGNFNTDPYPEIVIVSNGKVLLFDHTGSMIWGPVTLPGGGQGGPPTISDLDNDGKPEIGVSNLTYYTIFETDGSIKWQQPIVENSKGVTGSTTFDFEGDGNAEVIYADQDSLRIYKGDGTVLAKMPRSSATGCEYPLVVDINKDNHAEIVIPANNAASVNPGTDQGIIVIGQDSWVGTRGIWNQHSYHITNVNDDATIPQHEYPSWFAHNTYRLNIMPQAGAGPLAAPDLIPSYLIAVRSDTGTTITARIGNAGAITVAPGVSVTFYDNDPSGGGILLDTVKTTIELKPGMFETVTIAASRTDLATVWVKADDNGFGSGTVNESNENNNSYQFTNHTPIITSLPNTTALVNVLYRYEIKASDSDVGDVIKYILTRAPSGMTIDSISGKIGWNPGVPEIGDHPVSLLVRDDKGWGATQNFVLSVVAEIVNHAPLLASIPDTTMEAGDTLDIEFAYRDDDGDAVQLKIVGTPGFASLINIGAEWATCRIVPSQSDTGVYGMAIRASDGKDSTDETFTLRIIPKNLSPRIISTPVYAVMVGESYTYDVDAIDPNNDTLRYRLDTLPSGMTIDSISGRITWVPDAGQHGDHRVKIRVTDGRLNAYQWYTIAVNDPANNAPIITSVPIPVVRPGREYQYQVKAIDADNDLLSYSLARSPGGMLISDSGFITWPAIKDRDTIANVTVRVADNRGRFTEQSWTIRETDVLPPKVVLHVAPDNMPLAGRTITVQVVASSIVPIEYRTVKIGTNAISLDAHGIGSYTTSSVGILRIVGTAQDIYGQSDSAVTMLFVGDPNDVTSPIVAFADSDDCMKATNLYNIIGTATDENSVYFEMYYRLQGTKPWYTFVKSQGNVENSILGRFDPTVLRNGSYEIRLTAVDPSGHASTTTACAVVEGGLKVGQVNFAQNDLTVPAHGFPLSVVREYDSRNPQSGDFGPGWNLAQKNVSVQPSDTLGAYWNQQKQSGGGMDTYYLLEERKHYVVVKFADNDVLKFEMDVNPKISNIVPLYGLTVDYKPVENTQGSLQAIDVENDVILQEPALMTMDADVYNPKRFMLTRRDGTSYIIGPNGIEQMQNQYGDVVSYSDNGITHSGGASISFIRGEEARIDTIRDNFGTTLVYTYGPDGTLAKVTQIGTNQAQRISQIMGQYTFSDIQGNILNPDTIIKHSYNDEIFGGSLTKRLTEIKAPDNTVLGQFEYDSYGRMTAILDPEGNRVVYGYDVPNHTQTVTDRLGNVTTYNYDSKGNVTRKEDALHHVTQWAYDSDNNMTRETLPNGAVNAKTYNAAKDVLSETNALNQTTTYTYDNAGRVLTKTDAIGRVFSTERDAKGNPNKEYGPSSDTVWSSYDLATGNLITQKGMNRVVSAFSYDANGQVTMAASYKESSPTDTLSKSRTVYDPKGRPERSIQYVNLGTDSLDYIITRTYYDWQGQVIGDSSIAGSTLTRYDGLNRKIASRNQLGQWTHFVYDNQNRIVKTIMPDMRNDNDGDPQDPDFSPAALNDNLFTATSYDPEGRTDSTFDQFGNLTRYEYDQGGNRRFTYHNDVTRSEQQYDDVGNVIVSIDRLNNTTRYMFDLLGRDTCRIDAAGGRWSSVYNDAGNRVASIDPLHRATTYHYDISDRLDTTTYADNSKSSRVYDRFGNVIAETDQAGRTTWMDYDSLGRLVTVKQLAVAGSGDTSYTRYEYDSQGRKTAQVDALGHRTEWTYDMYGRTLSRKLPEGQTEYFDYFADGRRKSHTNFDGSVTNFEYDSQGRLTGQYWGAIDGTPDVSYQFDDAGRIAQARKGSVSVQYAYDNTKKTLASLTYPGIGSIAYQYDPLGRRTQLTTTTGPIGSPHLRTVHYGYDVLSRLEQVSGDHGITKYGYDLAGAMTRAATIKGTDSTVTAYSHDNLGRVIGITTTNTAGAVIASYDYNLDQSGMVTRVQEHGGRIVNYTYDHLSRLLSETITLPGKGDSAYSFTYDKVGNRTAQTRPNGEVVTYTYDRNDRLLMSVSTAKGATSYAWNGNGEMTGETSPGKNASYAYDHDGRLISATVVTGTGTMNSLYEYDPNGNRVKKTIDGTETAMLVDPSFQFAQVLEEIDANTGNPAVSYTYGNDLISIAYPEALEGNAVAYYQHDRIGSVRMVTDASGKVLNDYTYEAYGDAISQNVTVPSSYKYTGEQSMDELGWYYLRARNYCPSVGRFGSVDPFEGVMTGPLTLNKYGYTEERPTIFVDPSGEMTLTEMQIINVAIGYLAISNVACGIVDLGKTVQLVGDAAIPYSQMMANIAISKVYDPRLFSRWFGKPTDESQMHVSEGVRRIKEALSKHIEFSLNIFTNSYINPFTDDYASTWPWSTSLKIYIDKLYITQPLWGIDSKAGTIIHELSHIVHNTDDVLFQGVKCYGYLACKVLAIKDPKLAIQNADSYMFFFEEAFMEELDGFIDQFQL